MSSDQQLIEKAREFVSDDSPRLWAECRALDAKLSTCPFCDSLAELEFLIHSPTASFWVDCCSCGAKSDIELTPECAVKSWNRRPQHTADLEARLSLAVEALKKIRDMKFIGGRDVAADIARQALANIKGEGGEDEPKLQ